MGGPVSLEFQALWYVTSENEFMDPAVISYLRPPLPWRSGKVSAVRNVRLRIRRSPTAIPTVPRAWPEHNDDAIHAESADKICSGSALS